MGRHFLLAALAGIAGAILFAVGVYGFLGGIFLCLAQVPLFAAGLSLGATAATVAGLIGGGVVLLAQGPVEALVFVLLCALAPAILSRLALLSRRRDDATQWYPAGRLLAWLTAMAGGYYLLAVVSASGKAGGLAGVIKVLLDALLDSLEQTQGAMAPEYATDFQEALTTVANWIPASMAIWWMFAVILGAAMAQSLLVRAGRNRRPTPSFDTLSLPRALALVLAGFLVFSLIPGPSQPIASTLAAIVLTAYFILGLAVVHAISRPWASRGTALAIFYTVLFLFGWPIMLVAGLGIVEQWSGVRARLAGPSHRQEDE